MEPTFGEIAKGLVTLDVGPYDQFVKGFSIEAQYGFGIFHVVLAVLFMRFVVLRAIEYAASRTETKKDDELIEVLISRVLSLTVIGISQEQMKWIEPGMAADFASFFNVGFILIIASSASVATKVILTGILDSLSRKKTVTVDGGNPMLIFLARGSIWAAAIHISATELGWDLTALLASLAVFSIIIGLAVQHTLGNIMNSFMLSLDRPFDVGDRIEVQGTTGTVVSIGMLSTKLLTFDELLVVIPNNTLVTETVTNHARGGGDGSSKRMVMMIDIGVDYDEKTAHVKQTLINIANSTSGVLKDPQPMVLFKNFGDHTKDYTLYAWLKSFTDFHVVRDRLLSEIDEVFDSEGIVIPYPIAVELDTKPSFDIPAKKAFQEAAEVKMATIDARTARRRTKLHAQIEALNERMGGRGVSKKKREAIKEEIGILETMLSSLDND